MNSGPSEIASPGCGRGWPMTALVFAFALFCFWPPPGDAPLAGTEAHRALSADGMVRSGDYLVPRLFGRVYLAKPPLHYWIQAFFEKLTGRATPFVWRLPATLEGALLAAILCLFGNHWFGTVGGWVSGLCYVGMVTLWGENRGADIDVTNTLAATLAALCIIQWHCGNQRRAWAWILGAGLATGAALMVKGPAGLTIILGAWLWVAIQKVRQHGPLRLLSPSLWLPLLIGLACLGAYALAAYLRLSRHGMAQDWTGVQEAMQDLHPHDWTWRRATDWLLLGPTLFVFALPMSLALPLAFDPEVRGPQERRSNLILALAASVLLAWSIGFVSGMHLPRYAFVTLPLLCPLAGAIAADANSLRPNLRALLGGALVVTAVAFCAATLALSAMVWKERWTRGIDLAVCAAAVAVCAITLLACLRSGNWRSAWGLALLAGLLSVPFGFHLQLDKLARSGRAAGQQIAAITGGTGPIYCCALVLDRPDVFYYSGVPTQAMEGILLPVAKRASYGVPRRELDLPILDWNQVPSGSWVVLEGQELAVWKKEIPKRLSRGKDIPLKDNAAYLRWYAVQGSP